MAIRRLQQEGPKGTVQLPLVAFEVNKAFNETTQPEIIRSKQKRRAQLLIAAVFA